MNQKLTRTAALGSLCALAATLGLRSHSLAASGAAVALAKETYPVQHTDQEWQKLLPHDRYEVLRQAATEPPFSSELDHEKRKGLYTCAGCNHHLFSSETKYDSGSGWPSFYQPLKDAVKTSQDNSMFETRTEVHCAECGGHLGHVFDDGPRPTGLRYCMNGLALNFAPDKTS